MVEILEIGRLSFKNYKKDIVATSIFALVSYALSLIIAIPIVGIILGAYITPKILGWYFSKAIGNIKPNYKLAFKVHLVYLLLLHIFHAYIFILTVDELIKSLNVSNNLELFSNILISFFKIDEFYSKIILENFTFLVIYLSLLLISSLIFFYPIYASILGKYNEFKIDYSVLKKSAILTLYFIIWYFIIFTILGYIIAIIPYMGDLLLKLYELFIVGPMIDLILANKALSM